MPAKWYLTRNVAVQLQPLQHSVANLLPNWDYAKSYGSGVILRRCWKDWGPRSPPDLSAVFRSHSRCFDSSEHLELSEYNAVTSFFDDIFTCIAGRPLPSFRSKIATWELLDKVPKLYQAIPSFGITVNMGSVEAPTEAILHFGVPDFSVPAEERGFFAFPAYESVSKVTIPLRDARSDSDITGGPEGLDAQGFTYLNHRSVLADNDRWFEGDNIEKFYLQECEDLIQTVTGARRSVAINCSFRRRPVNTQSDPKAFVRRGCEIDENLAKLPRDKCTVLGKTLDSAREPARIIHVDYSLQGLKDTARFCRKDIAAAGQQSLAAEDEGIQAPRYAAYSVWRPVSTVKRDPLVVCDARTMRQEDLVAIKYRNPSSINASGDFIMTAYNAKPPEKPVQQKWYWMPQQTQDEVLVIKFADTGSENNSNIAAHCAHGSPLLPAAEEEAPRESVEVRVLAFW